MILELILVGITSLILTLYIIPLLVKELNKRKIVVKDIYKDPQTELPTQGAIIVLLTLFIISSLSPLIQRLIGRITNSESYVLTFDSLDLSILLLISLFAFYGLFDDIVDLGWWRKIVFPVIFTYPLIPFLEPELLYFPLIGNIEMSTEVMHSSFGEILLSDIFKVIIIPIYIMVCSNLQNMHSGFNGLQSGLCLILLSTLLIKCNLEGTNDNLLIFYCLLGSIFGFWFYNRYPARIIEGNIGSLSFGAAIGTLIVMKDLYFFGIFILIPHIFDFFLFLFIRLTKRDFIKFGSVNDQGIIIAPNPFKLKFLLPHYFKLKEYETVNCLHLISLLFCLTALIFF